MHAKLNLFDANAIKFLTLITIIFLSFGLTSKSFAVVIDFDDLNPVYDEYNPCWCDNPLTDQYLSKGVEIGGAWVNGADSHNVMLTSNSAWISFVGELPTFVSFNVTSEHEDAILFNVSGPNGLNIQKYSAGWIGPDEEYIPKIPNELISFSSEFGIQGITIEGVFDLRTGAAIDNLTFTYSSVPEPSSIALVSFGLLGILIRRYKNSKHIRNV